MMYIGDRVEHIGFPPAEGEVIFIQEMNTFPKSYNVCVKLNDGRLQWDMEDSWNVLASYQEPEDDFIIDGGFRILED